MDTIGKKLALKEKMAYGSPPLQLAAVMRQAILSGHLWEHF